MKTTHKGVFKPDRVIKNDSSTKTRLQAVGAAIRGRDVFQKSNKAAEAILRGLKSIPTP